jgi:hypothetical protein
MPDKDFGESNHSRDQDKNLRAPPSEIVRLEDAKMVENLLIKNWGDKLAKPRASSELLEIGREILEPLFHEPPLGSIPEYLRPHSRVHGCVAEYEERLAELEKWKAGKLNSWLQERVGRKYCAGGKVYELCRESSRSSAPEKYRFRLIEALG